MAAMPMFVLILFLLTASVIARETFFVNPLPLGTLDGYQNNPLYKVGQSFPISWQTAEPSVALLVIQQYPQPNNKYRWKRIDKENSERTATWIVSLDNMITSVLKDEFVVLYFTIENTQYTLAKSQFFNVSVEGNTKTASTTTSTSAATMATAATTMATAATTTATAAASQTASANSAHQDSSLSSGAIAGIAVGSALGGLALIGGVGFFIWKWLRRNKPVAYGEVSLNPDSPQNTPKLPVVDPNHAGIEYAQRQYMPYRPTPIHEAP